ncbi:MAG: hypothetical protein E7639_04265 [Ruminococcaceae bacterium]|nr:hypothetical protein [Oscillospiraceae bacterium]
MPVRVGLKVIEIWNDSMEKYVQNYEKEEAPQGQIVFYGPSYYTRWSTRWDHTPLREVLRGKSGAPCCVNRGFGSSCPEHQLYYYPRMIKPLAPSVLVYGSWGNSEAFGYSNEEAFELAQRVIVYALTDFPELKIYLSGAHPTRDMTDEQLKERLAYNELLREFAKNTPRCTFFDPLSYEPLHRKDIYVEDGVHYNQEGYDLYADFFKEVLKDELERF